MYASYSLRLEGSLELIIWITNHNYKSSMNNQCQFKVASLFNNMMLSKLERFLFNLIFSRSRSQQWFFNFRKNSYNKLFYLFLHSLILAPLLSHLENFSSFSTNFCLFFLWLLKIYIVCVVASSYKFFEVTSFSVLSFQF